jgi:hypothetical protein
LWLRVFIFGILAEFDDKDAPETCGSDEQTPSQWILGFVQDAWQAPAARAHTHTHTNTKTKKGLSNFRC